MCRGIALSLFPVRWYGYFTRARTILKKCHTDIKQTAVAALSSRCQVKEVDAPAKCYVTAPITWLKLQRKRMLDPRRSVLCYRCKQRRHIARNFLGQEAEGQDLGTILLSSPPQSPLNRALSTMTVLIDRMRCTALVNTGCMQTLICKACCQAWERKEVHMLTVGRSVLKCCGVSVVWLGISTCHLGVIAVPVSFGS